MEISPIKHIGIAVQNLKEVMALYENTLGLECYDIVEAKDQKVKSAFFKVGQTIPEFLGSLDINGLFGKSIDNFWLTHLIVQE